MKNVFRLLGMFLLIGCTSFTTKGDLFQKEQDHNNLNPQVLSTSDEDYGEANTDLTVDVRSIAVTDLTTSLQLLISFSDDGNTAHNYYVGYWGEGDEYLPAKVSYTVRDSNGNIEERSTEINKFLTNNPYDGIGTYLGTTSYTTYCDVPLAKGEELLYEEEIRLFNIFFYDSNTRIVDFDDNSYVTCTTSRITQENYPNYFNMDKFIDITYSGAADYSNYSAFSFHVDNYATELYPTLSSTTASMYSRNESDILAGNMYVRTTFSFGGDTKYIITYKDDTVETLSSIAKVLEVTDGGKICLLFEDVKASDVKNIVIQDIYLNVGIWSITNNRIIARTTFTQRFGSVYTGMTDLVDTNGNVVEPLDSNTYLMNDNLIISLIALLSTALFWGIVIPSYFYLKKKNRNDEFKRMNTKSYYTTATYGYIFIESFILLVTYITIRATNFANSLAVYNPTDVFIIVFGVISIILGGYFIRYFYLLAKNNAEKRRRDRLKLNQDVIDDGTIINVHK